MIESDPQSVVGIYVRAFESHSQMTCGLKRDIQLSGIDYFLYRRFQLSFPKQRQGIPGFRNEIARWRSKLTRLAPVLKWDWDDDGYLVYIPYKDSKSEACIPNRASKFDIPNL
jgi:hypothetical protein